LFLLKSVEQICIKSNVHMRTQKQPPAQDRKKKYELPALTVYGPVWELTQKVGPAGQLDGRRIGTRIRTRAG